MEQINEEPLVPVGSLSESMEGVNDAVDSVLSASSDDMGMLPVSDFDEKEFEFASKKKNVAQLNVGGSVRSFEKRHGLRKSKLKRFVERKVTGPIASGVRATLDLVIKSMGLAKLDYLRIARGKFSDKENYVNGPVPLVVRFPFNFGGTFTFVSLLMDKTKVGNAVTKYRARRRERIDRMKNYLGEPLRRLGGKISRMLPFYEERYKVSQRARARIDSLDEAERKIESWMHGGISGMRSRIKRNGILKKRRNAEVKSYSRAPVVEVLEREEEMLPLSEE